MVLPKSMMRTIYREREREIYIYIYKYTEFVLGLGALVGTPLAPFTAQKRKWCGPLVKKTLESACKSALEGN